MVALPSGADGEPQRTHVESKKPQIDIRHLADYMAASRQAQRGVVRNCKYRRIARVVQHTQARAVVFNAIRANQTDKAVLKARADTIRNKLADDDFEVEVNEHNADYVECFAANAASVVLPKADIMSPRDLDAIELNGVSVRFGPALLLRRTMKTNRQRSGAVMLRYAKGKTLPISVGEWQAAGIFGFLRVIQEVEAAEPEHALCIVLDIYSSKLHSAPSNAVYRFNEMRAACADIAERWPNIEPPKGAVL